MILGLQQPHWRDMPSCADPTLDPGTCFPDGYSHQYRTQVDTVRHLCAACPVIDQCQTRIDQLEAHGHMEDGMWAGQTPSERKHRRQETPQ